MAYLEFGPIFPNLTKTRDEELLLQGSTHTCILHWLCCRSYIGCGRKIYKFTHTQSGPYHQDQDVIKSMVKLFGNKMDRQFTTDFIIKIGT